MSESNRSDGGSSFGSAFLLTPFIIIALAMGFMFVDTHKQELINFTIYFLAPLFALITAGWVLFVEATRDTFYLTWPEYKHAGFSRDEWEAMRDGIQPRIPLDGKEN